MKPHLALPTLLLALTCACSPPGGARPPVAALSNMQHPPFSSWDESGRAVGLEVDLLEEAATRIGREVEWEERPFGELISSAASGAVDISASTIGITEERAELVTFSRPYFETTIVALVRQEAGAPKTLDDLAGLRVATERSTTAVGATTKRVPDAERVLDRPDERSWAELLIAGEVDAVVLDRSHAENFMRAANATFEVIEEPLRVERFAFAVKAGADELLEALNSAIDDHAKR